MKQDILSFGTAGIRGIEGEGFAYINEQTIFSVAVGIRDYLVSQGLKKQTIILGYDTRLHSYDYEQIFIKVFSSSKITVLYNTNVSQTSLITFGTRLLSADLGIMITSSHNKAEYNGVKVVGMDGIQIDDKTAKKIEEYIAIARDDIKNGTLKLDDFSLDKKFIKKFPKKMTKKFKKLALSFCNKKSKKLNIVYTPLHGTGAVIMPELFNKAKFKNIHFVEEQMAFDSKFSTCPYPNPEMTNVYKLAKQLACQVDADIIFASDPDADRMGVMIKTKSGDYRLLNGNEVGIILCYYLLSKYKKKNDKFVVSTVVSSPYVEDIAKFYECDCYFTLTGFKNIGAKMQEIKNKKCVFAFEESCGYVVSDRLRDKDSISAIMCFSSLAEQLKLAGSSIEEYLEHIYSTIGFGYVSRSEGVEFRSVKIAQNLVNFIRKKKPKVFAGEKITSICDFSKTHNSNFLKINFLNKCIIIRPSGTEPKLKFYVFVKFAKEWDKADEVANRLLENSIKEINNIKNSEIFKRENA